VNWNDIGTIYKMERNDIWMGLGDRVELKRVGESF